MRIERREGSDERRIVTGMIVNTAVCGAIAARWPGAGQEGLFASRWANLVADWCVKYHARYAAAPGRAIEGAYERWAERGRKDEDTAALVERFLQSISEEYAAAAENYNPEYTLDLAGKVFNRVRAERFIELLQADIEAGDEDPLTKRTAEARRIELGAGAGVDMFRDPLVAAAAFANQEEEVLIRLRDGLGGFFGKTLCRDAFISFVGPEKRGKTWWLVNMAFEAVAQRRRVAFFEVGDMTQNQVVRRFGVRTARLPLEPGTYQIPRSIAWTEEPAAEEPPAEEGRRRRGGNQASPVSVVRVPKELEGIDADKAARAFADFMERQCKSRESLFQLSCHAAGSISVADIRNTLADWERQGWVPDVVVIDYADILAPPPGRWDESREAINATWMALRAMSQELHALVITATQANAESYTAETIGRQHFSGDKRKNAHVTGMVGLNQTDAEKRDGIMRLNWVQLREYDFSQTRYCYTAGCLALGNPAIRSIF